MWCATISKWKNEMSTQGIICTWYGEESTQSIQLLLLPFRKCRNKTGNAIVAPHTHTHATRKTVTENHRVKKWIIVVTRFFFKVVGCRFSRYRFSNGTVSISYYLATLYAKPIFDFKWHEKKKPAAIILQFFVRHRIGEWRRKIIRIRNAVQ